VLSAAELVGDRWGWAEAALAELRVRLRGLADATEHAHMAHVMVVGDTQVGKTTLILRLLGVREEAQAEASAPLRGDRGTGLSATAVPIRYAWSGHPTAWSLRHGDGAITRLVTGGELSRRLAELRSDHDGIRWDPADRPLEIGLPESLAGSDVRRDVRMFDLPGLYADDPDEQDLAARLIAEYAPVMNLVFFVLSAEQVTDAHRARGIADNPFLADWYREPDRYRIVLTRTYSDYSVKDLVSAALPAGPVELEALVRAHVCGQLISSEVVRHIDPAIVFPVDLGRSWADLATSLPDRDYFSAVAPVNDRLLAALADVVAEASRDDNAHVTGPSEIVRRVERVVAGRKERRAARLAAVEAELAVATANRDEALALLRNAQLAHRKRAAALVVAEAAVERLACWYNPVSRPIPPMTGPAVRAAQEDERVLWAAAARTVWEQWQRGAPGFPRWPPSDLPADIRHRYDEEVRCCGLCEEGGQRRWFRAKVEEPDHCYGRMSDAVGPLWLWLRGELVKHATPTVDEARRKAAATKRRVDLAVRNRDERDTDARAAATAVSAMAERCAAEDAEDAQMMVVVTNVKAMHSAANEAYVRSLLSSAAHARPDTRAILFLGALRGVHDLDGMFKR
jgi:hypothetical protein